jgi:hypothetical protein
MAPSREVPSELGLDRLEQISWDDRLVLAWMALSVMIDLTEIDPVAQKMRQGTVGQRHAPDHAPR